MQVLNCVPEDLNAIAALYTAARNHQTLKKMVVWPFFDDAFLLNEIANLQQWKLVMDGKLVCNWAISFEDPAIWEERDNGDAIYIHRIATHPDYRGNHFVKKIVEWARAYAISINRKFVRLDTLGNNTRLIEHYTASGFNFLGMFLLQHTESLPLHYQKEPNCCLFEIAV